jgi:hypothetical protein
MQNNSREDKPSFCKEVRFSGQLLAIWCRWAGMILALLWAMTDAREAWAGLPHPRSWSKPTDDGRFMLVMISPLTLEEEIAGRDAEYQLAAQSLRSQYATSGLYPSDDNQNPVWTHGYTPPESDSHHVIVSPVDPLCLIVADDDWLRSYGHVVTFYHAGKRIAGYSMDDLISRGFRLAVLVKGGVNGEASYFDPVAKTFTIQTNHGDTLEFDVATGRLLKRSSMLPLAAGIVLGNLILMALILFFILRRKRTAI